MEVSVKRSESDSRLTVPGSKIQNSHSEKPYLESIGRDRFPELTLFYFIDFLYFYFSIRRMIRGHLYEMFRLFILI